MTDDVERKECLREKQNVKCKSFLLRIIQIIVYLVD